MPRAGRERTVPECMRVWSSGLEDWKDGRMEDWKGGRLEGWKIGRVEDWKDGRMEGWKDGRVLLTWRLEFGVRSKVSVM
jgi:hypothetical protein